MPDSFIVTIISASGSFEADLEIPSRLPFAGMKAKLLEIMKIMDNELFRGWDDYLLQYKNRAIGPEETLAEIGAFDGSRLIVVKI